MMRTHRCGDLRVEHIGEKVSVCGWVASRRDHGGVVFLDLRDAAGIVQVVVDPDATDGEDPHHLRAEYVTTAKNVRKLIAITVNCRPGVSCVTRGPAKSSRTRRRTTAGVLPARLSTMIA